MIVYSVEQLACWPEGPEGQRGLFSTREAAEQYMDDLLRLESGAFASQEEAGADDDSGYDTYTLKVAEIEVAESAPQLGRAWTIQVVDVESVRMMNKLFGGLHERNRAEPVRPHEVVTEVSHLPTTAEVEVVLRNGAQQVQGTDRDQVIAEYLRLQNLADTEARTA